MGCINLPSQQQNKRVPFSPTLSCIVCRFFFLLMAILVSVRWYLCSFDFHFSNNDVEHLLMCFLAICMFSLERCLFRSYANFFDWTVCFLVLNTISYLYIFEINICCFIWKYFLPFEDCLFILFVVFFAVQTGEGNGNPLQYYCLENPMDRGAW